jgi:hypothetical protein
MRFADPILSFSALAALVFLATGAATAQTGATHEIRYGPEEALGEGTVRTYLAVDANDNPVELGVAISETAMATLPDLSQKPPMESFIALDLELPEGAPAPYKLVGFDWNSIGHPPVDIYGVPHFDFHFYTIDTATKGAILPGDGDVPTESGEFTEGPFAERAMKAPTAGYLPSDYAYAPGSAVPLMGGHWIDPASHEFHGQAFDKTFIYGTWDGKVIFIEPMITKAFIESKPEGSFEIPTAEKVPAPGWYPSRYQIRFDPEAREYRVALTSFAERN